MDNSLKIQILIATTTDGRLVFANPRINSYGKFQCAFYAVKPFMEDSIDETYCEAYLGGFDKEQLYDLCEDYDCSPGNLAYEYYIHNNIMDIVDCSLYPEFYVVGDDTWYFESDSCGQYDSRIDVGETGKIIPEAYDLVMELWDNFHLQDATDDCKKKLNKFYELTKDIDERKFIEKFIEKNYL